MLAEAGALDGFEKLLGDDRIGVDVDHRQGGGDGGELGEFLHLEVLGLGQNPDDLYQALRPSARARK